MPRTPPADSFGAIFWPTLLATVAGGLLVAWAVYWFLDRKLHFRRQAERAAEATAAERAVRDSVLRVALDEMQFAAAQIPAFRRALGNDSVPYPGFDTNGWTLISQTHAFTTIKPQSSEALVHVYNRLRTFNERLSSYADLGQGPTATLFHITAATATESPQIVERVDEITAQYETLLTMNSDGLRGRLEELEPHLHAAIDAVKDELGMTGEPPSAQFTYLPPKPPMIVPADVAPHTRRRGVHSDDRE